MESESRHDDERETARPDPTGQAPARERRKRQPKPRAKRRPLRHGTVVVLRILSAVVTALALTIVVIGWRLTSGPISLDFLTPTVQAMLSDPERGIGVAIEHTELSLEPETHTMALLAEGVTIRRTDGSAGMRLPRVALNLSLRAALSGTVAPTRIVLTAPQLRVERAPDGTIHLGFGEGSGSEDLARALLADLEVQPNQRGPLGYLREVAIREATLILDDRALGIIWEAKHADALLVRNETGIAGEGRVTIVAGDQEATMGAVFRYADAEHRFTGELSVADLEPARFAAAAQPLALLQALKIPITGRIGFTIDVSSLRVEGARCDVTVKSGRIEAPFLAGGFLPIAGGAAKLSYAPLTGRLAVDDLILDLDGPKLTASAEVTGVDPQFLRGGALSALDISGKLRLQHLAFDTLARYWPDSISPSSRSWVTGHVRDGAADDTRVEVHATIDLTANAPKPVKVDTVRGTISYSNVTVDYFPPLAPIREINGTAVFDRAHMDMLPTTGTLAGLRVSGATIRMSKLDTNDETIAIAVGVRGPLHDVLDVIDTRPLRYTHAFGVDPAKVSGAADVQVSFGFPLIHDLRIENVEYGAKAKVKGASVPGVAVGHDLTEGDLTLELDRNALKVQGTGQIDAIPAEFTWSQTLRAAASTRRYTLKTRLDDAARQRLGVDFFKDSINGPVKVDLTYAEQKGSAEASLALDLREASVAVQNLDWSKPAGVPLAASAKMAFSGGKLVEIGEASVQGEGMEAALSAAFAPETQELQRVELRRLATGNTDVAGSFRRQSKGGWSVALTGKSFDASKYLSQVGHGRVGGSKMPLTLEAKLERLIVGKGREIGSLSLSFVDDGEHWQKVMLDGKFAEGGTMQLRLGEPAGSRALQFDSDNLGAVLRVLDVTTAVVGGRVRIRGQSEDHDGRRIFGGHVEGENYKVVRAPLLARVLGIASLSGIESLLNSSEGIPFARLSGDFNYDAGTLKVSEARAIGGAIGLTAGGTVNLNDDTLDIAGTLVPAYTINSLLGGIPLLGDVLVGEEGGGVFAANFRVAGPIADPKVSVNPLSTLAPGFLRKLFMFAPGDPSRPPPNPSEQPFSTDTGR
ncbi:MAG: AsmA-like C-terminal domain-containing protein [Acidobacteriota bacterium]